MNKQETAELLDDLKEIVQVESPHRKNTLVNYMGHIRVKSWEVELYHGPDHAPVQVAVRYTGNDIGWSPVVRYAVTMEDDAIVYTGGGLWTRPDPPSYLTTFLVQVFDMLAQEVQE